MSPCKEGHVWLGQEGGSQVGVPSHDGPLVRVRAHHVVRRQQRFVEDRGALVGGDGAAD